MSKAARTQILVLHSDWVGEAGGGQGMAGGVLEDRGIYIVTLPDGATAVCLKLHALRSLSFTTLRRSSRFIKVIFPYPT